MEENENNKTIESIWAVIGQAAVTLNTTPIARSGIAAQDTELNTDLSCAINLEMKDGRIYEDVYSQIRNYAVEWTKNLTLCLSEITLCLCM